ncbi:MAG: hypothetical protein ACLP9L_38210 [Thermoguttaceae bacterium]
MSHIANENVAVVQLPDEGDCRLLALFFFDCIQQAVEFAGAERMSYAAQEYGDAHGRWK